MKQLEAAHAESVRYVCWHLSIVSLVKASDCLLVVDTPMAVDILGRVYTIRRKLEKRREALGSAAC